jgi:hypothetical protein
MTPARVARALVVARRMTSRPGYATSGSGSVHLPAVYSTVVTLHVPAAATPTYILEVRLQVDVPIRTALSVRGWCHAGRADMAEPHSSGSGQVLITGQNPLPGSRPLDVLSRRIFGRALVEVPATGGTCQLQLSPRTEATVGSWMDIVSGTLTVTPVRAVAVGVQSGRVYFGGPGAPATVSVARTPAGTPSPGPFVVHGEVELTVCYGSPGYGLCPPAPNVSSTVEARLVLERLATDGTVCRVVRGVAREVVIDPKVHHRKVVLAPLADPGRAGCGKRIRAYIEVAHRSGNSMEVEASGLAVPVQTLAWVDQQP